MPSISTPSWARAVANRAPAGAWRFVAAVLCTILTWALAAGAAQAEPRTHTVVIENMQFMPATLAVRVGDRIVWRNDDLVPHTATTLTGRFDSGTIAHGKSWTHVAGQRGTLPYVCTFHPMMKAALVVQ